MQECRAKKRKANENVYQLTMHFVQTPVDHWEVHINPVSQGHHRDQHLRSQLHPPQIYSTELLRPCI